MYDSVMNAFGSSQSKSSPLNVEEERKKLTAELIANEITKNHPKVKDIVAEALLALQDRMHEQREQAIKDIHQMEKQV
jgi:hypothetical protein